MIKSNCHTHTKFCDGKDTPKEMIEKAVSLGFNALGFSSHAFTPYCSYGLVNEDEYVKTINQLKLEYKDKIQIYCGVEEDAFHFTNRKKYDYIIGSCHYVKKENEYFPIDSSYNGFLELLKSILLIVQAHMQAYTRNQSVLLQLTQEREPAIQRKHLRRTQ